ncbi:general odorant-binding protein 56a [Drosophila pseudoobscura]|uniref:General odorant-binding protein 56a n=1 Tax=Drosophila pseudoobscura pseudoobscura TaxID=46245 RepID=A0A6I8UWI2_DROPS|nr:general odorant-binding protein 56a [Drosophila pseudoobscura]
MNRASVVLLLMACLTVLAEGRYAKVNLNLGLTVADEAPRPLSEAMVRLCGEQTDIALQQHDLSHPSEPVQCFTHCLYEQMGLLHDGVFVERDLIGLLSDASNPAAWPERQCHAIRGSNKCETAFRIHQCRQQLKEQHDPEATKEADTTSSPSQADDFLP